MAEGQDLKSLFEKLGAIPKADTPGELLQWMKDFVTHKEDQDEHEPTLTHGHSDSHGSLKQVLSHQVRLPNFSGDGKDATYDLWRYEVKCLTKEHRSKDVILQAIRRSLKGEAARIAMRLGPGTSVDELLQKFDSVYGEVEPSEVLLAKFYSARQQRDEDVSTWSCRLEDLLTKAKPKGQDSTDQAQLLRVMFWSGLRDDLKDISGHLYESDKDYDQLRVAVRRIEQDHKVRQLDNSLVKKTTTCKANTSVDDTQLTDLRGLIQQLSTEVKALRQDHQRLQTKFDTESTQSMYQQRHDQPVRQQQQSYKGRQRDKGKQWTEQRDQQHDATDSHREQEHPMNKTDTTSRRNITCWNCGQEGHIAVGCRVRTDHRRKGLNFSRPTPRGGQ